ncbi:hypothetical protein BKA67DRAFT_551719 [Truncatella angustata]|uniref:Uncharacterized protein n=1 Tax=Truncatella angustata TaxID=152316 RepID=A0A9P9A0V2_9PEZI|nr:uncharacterized protein BKA67DRAFT_551719 [Truncatella angustata]KAH6656360.1 hypothetical protein BKA67DRAFT_551719 [Truncatella angustata]KAH8198521.1 hypothetical protein TruAng_007300 [Truncatella angustata]
MSNTSHNHDTKLEPASFKSGSSSSSGSGVLHVSRDSTVGGDGGEFAVTAPSEIPIPDDREKHLKNHRPSPSPSISSSFIHQSLSHTPSNAYATWEELLDGGDLFREIEELKQKLHSRQALLNDLTNYVMVFTQRQAMSEARIGYLEQKEAYQHERLTRMELLVDGLIEERRPYGLSSRLPGRCSCGLISSFDETSDPHA